MDDPEKPFEFVVKPAEAVQIDCVHRIFSPGDYSRPQHRRYEVQSNGEGVYLIAWHLEAPVGGFLVRWSGPQDEAVSARIDVTNSAFLEGGLTIDEYRRKGVATAIIGEAERLAKEHGCTRIGLEVGSSDNPDAKRLYEKLGYVDWGHGDLTIRWGSMDAEGNTRMDAEVVTFMDKPL
ncbi:Acetyltransferase (GNAT) family protein [Paenibacillus sp. UNC496MF]|uniref:GNAT family N-acetyltransferase n=1 Tax=Paenibacillus sp. UNC496MF TaxID=1502753 RepID=UPI0008E3D3C1|nr:GNAT family N-acetyltransferase [Paenibacillus sp. UNC496MF]SFJ33666.1 Acetyltransferase (GNAT) family protein [Paenibacillus sp. UNC496MF]